MIPMIARVHFRQEGRRHGFRLWIPLFLVWILLLPIALLILPLLFVACLFMDINPFRLLEALGAILSAVRGTHIEVDEPRQKILIEII